MKETLAILAEGKTLSMKQTVEAFEQIMTGQATHAQMGAMLGMVRLRGPSIEEITGAATVMRYKATQVDVPEGLTAVDTCGTGGDHSQTFNISTAAAIVVAGAGREHNIVVAKHGNRALTSRSGSSQVLETLGVNLQVSPETLTRCLDEAGICFCFAPAHHPAMKHVMPVRLELGFRTLFNILGPLTNPAGARRQVMGVFDPKLTQPLAQVLANLGSEHAMVVYGRTEQGGLDEIVNTGPTRISHLVDGQISTTDLEPQDLGISPAHLVDLQVDSPESSAAVIREVISGRPGPARDIVCLNAAAGLVVAGLASDLREGLALAGKAIDDGKAHAALDTLVAVTQAAKSEG